MNKAEKQQVEKLYYETYESLFWYALSRLKNWPLAEEAVQSTFLIACTKPQSLLESPNPRGWLTSTLKNVLRNMTASRVRQMRLVQPLFEVAEEKTPAGAQVSPRLLLYETLSNVLSREDIRLFQRIVFDRCSMLEAAQELGISVQACSKRMQRARKKIRDFLEKME